MTLLVQYMHLYTAMYVGFSLAMIPFEVNTFWDYIHMSFNNFSDKLLKKVFHTSLERFQFTFFLLSTFLVFLTFFLSWCEIFLRFLDAFWRSSVCVESAGMVILLLIFQISLVTYMRFDFNNKTPLPWISLVTYMQLCFYSGNRTLIYL